MVNLTDNLEEAKYVTHAGNFHADDVFATAFLEKKFKNITLIRLKSYNDDETKLAYDIGFGKFDHHQSDYNKKRDNGIHYCSFGLLWQEYGLSYLKEENIPYPEETFKVFDYLLVNSIDAIDNGEFDLKTDYNIYSIPNLIALFRPKFDEEVNINDCFLEAVKFASYIFDLVLKESVSKVKSIKIVEKNISKISNRTLILEENISYEFALFFLKLNELVDFVITPHERGGYGIHTVPIFYRSYTPKVPLKKEWGGLKDNALQAISGIPSAKFCHKNLFLATTETLDDALLMISKTLEK